MTTIKPASIVNPVTPIGDNGSIFVPFAVDTYSGNKGSLRTSLPIDRGGTLSVLHWTGTYGNHTETQRASYTVPSGKYTLMNNCYIGVTKPSTTGNVWLRISVSGNSIVTQYIDQNTVTIDSFRTYYISLYLPYGTTVTISTANQSSSNIIYEGTVYMIEFNS